MRPVHRVVWIALHGDPGKLKVLHTCDNPPCCNPRHLFLGTPKDNTDDMISKGRARFWTPGRDYQSYRSRERKL
jgi:HNH endonuclease